MYYFCAQAVIFSVVAECDTFVIWLYIHICESYDSTKCDLHNKYTFNLCFLLHAVTDTFTLTKLMLIEMSSNDVFKE